MCSTVNQSKPGVLSGEPGTPRTCVSHLRDTPEKSAGLCPFPFPFQIWDDGDGCRDNVSPPGVGYRLVHVKDTGGNIVLTHERDSFLNAAAQQTSQRVEW